MKKRVVKKRKTVKGIKKRKTTAGKRKGLSGVLKAGKLKLTAIEKKTIMKVLQKAL